MLMSFDVIANVIITQCCQEPFSTKERFSEIHQTHRFQGDPCVLKLCDKPYGGAIFHTGCITLPNIRIPPGALAKSLDHFIHTSTCVELLSQSPVNYPLRLS